MTLKFMLFLFFFSVPIIAAAGDEKNPVEAGARYGQAQGAAEVCPGVVLGKKALTLKSSFLGENLAVFVKKAATVYASWQKVKNCVLPSDPNPCRIIIQISCQSALSEIGPDGTAEAGLIATSPSSPEFK